MCFWICNFLFNFDFLFFFFDTAMLHSLDFPFSKSRGIYESPGAKILYEAHLDLEVYLLDREVLRVKSYLADKMADYVYNGKNFLTISLKSSFVISF